MEFPEVVIVRSINRLRGTEHFPHGGVLHSLFISDRSWRISPGEAVSTRKECINFFAGSGCYHEMSGSPEEQPRLSEKTISSAESIVGGNMRNVAIDTDVLIVGAGPVGLFLANECARRGLRWRIVEARPGQSQHSKALAIMPRTLEIFDMAGLAVPFLEVANRV